jgi:hypothetical protein
MNRIFALSIVFSIALTSADAQQSAPQPDIHVGDRWTFRQKDGFTDDSQGEFTRRVVSVSQTEIAAVIQTKGRPGETVQYFARDWNLLDNGVVRFEPNLLTWRFPMKIGDVWRGQYKLRTIATGNTITCTSVGKVLARETVTVPAGNFEAFKIENRRECANATLQGPSTLIVNTDWYAPSVRSTVKAINSSFLEGRERSRNVVEMTGDFLADSAEPANPDPTPGIAPVEKKPARPEGPTDHGA